MIKKNQTIICFLCIFFFAPQLFAQSKAIYGGITDSITHAGLPYALLYIKNTNDSLITSKYSDEKGGYLLEFPENTQGILYVKMMGYKSWQTNLSKYKNSDQIGLNIQLTPENINLKEVVVTAEAADVTKKFDRTVYKIKDEQKENANDLYDILSSLPGVVVDKENGTVRFRGEKPEVLVDNMPASIMYPKLEMIDIKNLESVELIDRSALYGGEGKGGLINVKMKQKKKNYTGAFLSNETAYLDEADRLNLFNNFLNVNTMLGPFILFNNLTRDAEYNIFKTKTNGTMQSGNTLHNTHFNSSTNTDNLHLDNTCGFYIPANTTQILFAFAYMDDEIKTNDSSKYFIQQPLLITDDYYNLSTELRTANTYAYHAKIYQEFKNEKSFSFTFTNMKVKGSSEKEKDYTYSILNGLGSDSIYNYSMDEAVKTKTTLYEFYYNHPFNAKSRFNIHGSRFCDEYPENTLHYYIWEDEYLPFYRAGVKKSVYSKAGANYGRRMEKFLIDGTVDYVYHNNSGEFTRNINGVDTVIDVNIKNNFISPSLRITYNLNKKNDLYVGYGYTNQLATPESYLAFVDKQDPHNWQSGNPKLKPEYFHNAYFSYKYSKPDTVNFSSELFYRSTYNGVNRVAFPLSPSLNQIMPQNMAINQRIGADISFWLRYKKYWTAEFSSQINHTYYESGELEFLQTQINQNIIRKQFGSKNELNIGYSKKKYINIGLFLDYNTKELTFTGFNKSYFNAGLAISRRFFDDHLFINIAAENFYCTNKHSVEDYLGIKTNTVYRDCYAHEPYFRIYMYYIFRSGDKGTKDLKLK